MTSSLPQRRTSAATTIATLIAMASLVLVASHIVKVISRDGETAFLSANDRSRWCMITAIVDEGTFAIDGPIATPSPIKDTRRPWDTIDKVQHRGRDGQLHYYSSKPPLYPIMVAGVYAIVQAITGLTLPTHPIHTTRMMLLIVNLPVVMIWLGSCYAIVRTQTRGARTTLAAMMVAGLGVMVLPYAVSLSNHLPAAAATALVAAIYLASPTKRRLAWAFVAGLGAGFAVANELPALAMAGLWGALFVWWGWRPLVVFSVGFLIVAIAFFGTTWWAHESLKVPYAHRGNGDIVFEIESSDRPAEGQPPEVEALINKFNELDELSDADRAKWKIEESDEPNRFRLFTHNADYAIIPKSMGYEVRHWDDWYEYPGSYWQTERRGVDRGERSRLRYLFHMTLGRYGVVSLTPIWILVPLGILLGVSRGRLFGSENDDHFKRLSVATVIVTVVVFAFYMARPLIDRNYGGVSVSLRWTLWLTPLWFAFCIEPLRRMLSRRGGVVFASVLIAAGIWSVMLSIDNPWQSPWIYRWIEYMS
ncbi:MAG: hypothetical protein AAF664_17770 [Planctomycetota bacterium]